MLRNHSHWPTVVAIIGSCLCSFLLAGQVAREVSASGKEGIAVVETLWTWANVNEASTQTPPAEPDVRSGAASDFRIDVTLRADGLTAMMLCMVTFVASLVAIYSVGYMHGDRGYWRFFTYVSLFVFSMTMLVLVSNFLLLYVFWEAVGACSYLLIGFWYEKSEAAAAGKKAFLVNRIGDFGFALALFLIWTTYGTLNFHDTNFNGVETYGVLGQARLNDQIDFSASAALAICLLLMLGACGKSAQFPLHVWLPDAMEGPTPVSALIHAATMVTAGVYMVARCTPLFMVSPDAQLVVACIGGFTALLGGLIALTQYDLKRVLAYSTISQLGYMFLALGTGTLAGVVAAMFHLFTHAFFKALLFLGAGSVMHAMGNVIDMRRFGGLRHVMPITCATFAIGCLALAGVAPLSGFWSKDAILGAVHERVHEAEHELEHRGAAHGGPADDHADPAHETTSDDPAAHDSTDTALAASAYRTFSLEKLELHRKLYGWLYFGGIFTAFLTAFYTFRAFFMTFFGDQVIPAEAAGHAHESPRVMWMPLAVLAVFALFIGLIIFSSKPDDEGSLDRFAAFLASTPSLAYYGIAETTPPSEFHMDVAALSTVVALLGIALAAFLYLGSRREIDALTYVFDFRWLARLGCLFVAV